MSDVIAWMIVAMFMGMMSLYFANKYANLKRQIPTLRIKYYNQSGGTKKVGAKLPIQTGTRNQSGGT